MEDRAGPYLLVSERHEMGENPEKSLFLVMMAVILLRERPIDPPSHRAPESVGERPTLVNPPQLISPIESVNLLQYVCRISDFHPESTVTDHRNEQGTFPLYKIPLQRCPLSSHPGLSSNTSLSQH
jgi:hypothetical protein